MQENAHRAWNQPQGDFRANLLADPRVMAHLSEAELQDCFDPQRHLTHLDEIFARLGI